MSDLQTTIEQAWEARDKVNLETSGVVRDAVNAALDLLDSGKARVAEKAGGEWQVNQWLKKAVLLSFRLNDMTLIGGGPGSIRLVGQGAVQVRWLVGKRVSRQRIPGGAELCGAEISLYRAGCDSHAVLRQPRRLCR